MADGGWRMADGGWATHSLIVSSAQSPILNGMVSFKASLSLIVCGVALAGVISPARAASDPYEDYICHSDDFRRVKQDKAWAYRAFPSWMFMPWTYQWNIGYTAESGRWSIEHGYNGAFIDRDDISTPESPHGRLDWINQFKLRFYVDHAADKGLLHLWDGNQLKPHLEELHSTGVRPVPLNDATMEKLRGHLQQNIAAVKSSPYRSAYALDDEASWGHFVHPTMWRVTDDVEAYPRWLKQIYGKDAPQPSRWVTYDDIRTKLPEWSVGKFDASPLMDQWTFNDTLWANSLGQLVEYANTLDPATPCGIVGGQGPSPFGGYDYARLMRKLQFIEAYNLGSSQDIIRSFNPHNALPIVTSTFHRSAEDDIWQVWYYLSHGNRGHIGWVEGWFDGKTPAPWHDQIAPTLKEAGQKIGPLMSGAEWQHDGIAIYYSHPSIQLGWILDAEAHGKTWVNRNSDERLSSAVHVRHAWENMLRDSHLQFNYLSYLDVIQNGIPEEYKTLILPACLCLSEAEARKIEAFCARGGTVIADYLPGLWDQHGKGRSGGGPLDEMFGVKHDPNLRAKDLFGGSLWVEVNQDTNYDWKTFDEFMTLENHCLLDGSGFHKAVRDMPVNQTHAYKKGQAVLMNLSPQYYNAYRAAGTQAAKKRSIFIDHILSAGDGPRVTLTGKEEDLNGCEITYWAKEASASGPARTILFVIANPGVTGTSLGGGNAESLKTADAPITLHFRNEVKDLRDERTGKTSGSGKVFSFSWKENEALVVSFETPK